MLPPVPEPTITQGQDARVALAATKGALNEANSRLVRSRKIYRGVRQSYGAKK